ncbi:hypothetical protein DH2020_022807 [Rehmannia glutinosa]|uniref:TraB domain-containing protein n=1 Tax=Rehmannia glutinosa TaxID=99300 RepID=A0ABR0W8P5_REHGL
MDPPSPAATNGVDDFVHVEEGDHSSGDNNEALPDNDGGSNENNYFYERKVLPPELSSSAVMLTCDSAAEGGVCDVYLVGTAHVSTESCKEVQAVIDFLKPQVVFLELCAGRVAVLAPQNFKQTAISFAVIALLPVPSSIFTLSHLEHSVPDLLRFYFILMMRFLILESEPGIEFRCVAGADRRRNGGDVEEKSESVWDTLQLVASKLEVFPGAEFRVAYEEAMKYGGKVILGDRPVQITLRRTWAKMPLWHKTKLLYSLMFQAVFLPDPDVLSKALKEMDDVDMLTLVIQEMSKQFPTLMETLVHERVGLSELCVKIERYMWMFVSYASLELTPVLDHKFLRVQEVPDFVLFRYMSAKLLKIASEHNSVVAVVGKGHLPGIQKNWKQPVDIKEILTIPSQRNTISVRKILSTIGVTVAGVAIISGIYLSIKK